MQRGHGCLERFVDPQFRYAVVERYPQFSVLVRHRKVRHYHVGPVRRVVAVGGSRLWIEGDYEVQGLFHPLIVEVKLRHYAVPVLADEGLVGLAHYPHGIVAFPAFGHGRKLKLEAVLEIEGADAGRVEAPHLCKCAVRLFGRDIQTRTESHVIDQLLQRNGQVAVGVETPRYEARGLVDRRA